MTDYLIRRVLWMAPVLLVISLVTFTVMKMAPGGPFDVTGGGRPVPEGIIESLNRRYHLDQPYWKQYLIYMGLVPVVEQAGEPAVWKGVLQGNLGPSYRLRGRTVQEILFQPGRGRPWWESRAARTAQLGVLGFLFGALAGVPIGVLAALHHNRLLDYASVFAATFFVATPRFVLAIFLILLFGLTLRWITIIPKWDQWQHWVLPVFCLGIGMAAFTTRLTRSTMLEVLRQDYVRTARAKGLYERSVVYGHALRNAMIPVATVFGPELAHLVTGSFFIEHMFSFPGMGSELVRAIAARDYSMIMGVTLIYTAIIAVMNLVVDVVYAWLDPRITYS